DVETARLEVEAHVLRDEAAEPLLLRGREAALEDLDARLLLRADDLLHERDELGLERREEGRELGRRAPGLELVEEGVVEVLPGRGEVLRRLALQVDHLLEPRREAREALLLARLRPRLLGARGRARHLLDELLRELPLAVVAASRLADHGGVLRGELLLLE